MEIYDIVMLVVLVGATLFGAVKGFAWQLASIASIIVSYLVAYNFREPFSQSIQAEPPWNRFLAMLILYVGTSLVIWMLFRMVSNTIDRLRLREFDRQIGALFGFAKGGLYCTLITLFAVTLLGDHVREKIVSSKSGRYIAQVLSQSESVIPPEIHEVVQPYLVKFDEKFAGQGASNGAGGGVSPWSSPGNNNGVLPDSFWGTASSLVKPASAPLSNPSSQPSWSIPSAPAQRESGGGNAWATGQSTPWNPPGSASQNRLQPIAPSASPYQQPTSSSYQPSALPQQQATQPSSTPWTPYQR